jgi:hypothetical protein
MLLDKNKVPVVILVELLQEIIITMIEINVEIMKEVVVIDVNENNADDNMNAILELVEVMNKKNLEVEKQTGGNQEMRFKWILRKLL